MIRDLRESAGLTQAQLAKRVGCSAPYISQIERATRVTQISRVRHSRIAAALGVEPSVITAQPHNRVA